MSVVPALTFQELAWAALFFRYAGETALPEAYMTVYRDTSFRNALTTDPRSLNPAQVGSTLIEGFLDQWNSRMKNNHVHQAAIIQVFDMARTDLASLSGMPLVQYAGSMTLSPRAGTQSAGVVVARIFNTLASGRGIGPTIAAKLMGIANPELFPMWDDAIATHYVGHPTGSSRDGVRYAQFLDTMHGIAVLVSGSFARQYPGAQLATHLSGLLRLTPPYTLAKFLDEYNWLTITRGRTVPPSWHP